MWKAIGLAFPLVGNWGVRKFGNKEKVKVGIDPWVRSGGLYKLSHSLIKSPQRTCIPNLAQENLQIRPPFGTKSGKM